MWLAPIRLIRMDHGRVVRTLDTAVGVGVAVEHIWSVVRYWHPPHEASRANNWNLPCCQCTETDFHVSSIVYAYIYSYMDICIYIWKLNEWVECEYRNLGFPEFMICYGGIFYIINPHGFHCITECSNFSVKDILFSNTEDMNWTTLSMAIPIIHE